MLSKLALISRVYFHLPKFESFSFCLLSLSEQMFSFTYPGLNHVHSIGSHQLGTLQDVYNALILGLVQKVVQGNVRP